MIINLLEYFDLEDESIDNIFDDKITKDKLDNIVYNYKSP